jgi:hypothetical protein
MCTTGSAGQGCKRSAVVLPLLLPPTICNPMTKSSLESAWQRFITLALREAVIGEKDCFSLHGLEHHGVTDAVGDRGDKQDAARHQSPATTGRYDHDLPIVKPPRRR